MATSAMKLPSHDGGGWGRGGGIQLLGAGIGKGKEGKKSHASLGPINEEGIARQATKSWNMHMVHPKSSAGSSPLDKANERKMRDSDE
jgi:hypothetical protein